MRAHVSAAATSRTSCSIVSLANQSMGVRFAYKRRSACIRSREKMILVFRAPAPGPIDLNCSHLLSSPSALSNAARAMQTKKTNIAQGQSVKYALTKYLLFFRCSPGIGGRSRFCGKLVRFYPSQRPIDLYSIRVVRKKLRSYVSCYTRWTLVNCSSSIGMQPRLPGGRLSWREGVWATHPRAGAAVPN